MLIYQVAFLNSASQNTICNCAANKIGKSISGCISNNIFCFRYGGDYEGKNYEEDVYIQNMTEADYSTTSTGFLDVYNPEGEYNPGQLITILKLTLYVNKNIVAIRE